MRHSGGYDRGYGAGRGFRGAPRGYDRGIRRYDAHYGGAPMGPDLGPVPFPFVPFGYDPMMGPMAWSVPSVPGPLMGGPGYDRGFRTPPRQSPAYGRGGDRALRAWADRYGYDVEYSIPPRGWPRR